MRKTDLLCRASLIASAFVGFTATPAMAQDSDPTASADDDVIVVVARKREEREARNPATGKTIKVPAKNYPVFKPGKTLKESCEK